MRITQQQKSSSPSLPITLIFLLLLQPSLQKQVDSFNLLFPTSYKHSIPPITGCYARQIVTTSGGCYNWQSTQPAVVRVVGTHHGLVPSQSAVRDSTCLTNGVIQLIHADRYGSSVYVTARDRDDQDIITIPVRIRDLKRIAVFTKSKIMNIKEVQNLQIYGFDAESNTFTSLEGLRFKWTITQIEEGKNSIGSVEKIPLKDSSLYMALDTRKKLENQEKVQSDWLVVKALRVGKVSVKVRCLQPNYQMLTDQITLFIQQKFQLSPSLQIHLLPGSTFPYKLLTPTGFQISLPYPHYKISFSNPDFSYKIEGNQLVVSCPRIVSGSSVSTSLTVSDTRTEPPFSQSVDIIVDQPEQLEIVMPGQIVIGGEGRYQVRFKKGGKYIKGNIDPIYLNVKVIEDANRNAQKGDVFMVDRIGGKIRATNKGSGMLRVQYNGITSQKKLASITPLKLLSPTPKILLPVSQIYQLTIIGGSGSYRYTFSQQKQNTADAQQILTLSSTGLITTRKEGNTIITVIDEKSKENRIDVRVEVRKIGQLFSLEEIREFSLDDEGSLYIGARPKKQGVASQQIYTQCNDALLRGLSLTPHPSSIPPLKILSTNPISYQTLRELLSLSEQNPQIQSQIQSYSSLPISTAQLMKIYEPYVRYGEIKESQLERIIIDMEDYGLCAKVMVKAGQIFDGEIGIEKAGYGDGVGSDRFKLRVYDKMVNNIKGYEIKTHNGKDQIVLAPQASFKWVIQGGPYSWQAVGQPPLQVSINKIKLDSQRSPQSHLFPTITCPSSSSSSSSTSTYTLKYRNPQTLKLLRPIEQEKQIIVHCRPVERLLIGLPIKKKIDSSVHQHSLGGFSAENRDKLNKEKDRYAGQFSYFVSDQKNSTVYINPDNCFRISVQPVLTTQSIPSLQYTNAQRASDSQLYLPYYNASNVEYEIIGSRNGKVQKIGHLNSNSNTPKDWNTYLITYDSKSRSRSSQQSDDYITISIKSPTTKNPLTHTIAIKTLKPLKLASVPPPIIDLPSHSLSSYTLKMSPDNSDSDSDVQFNQKRYSVLCDENLVKCKKLVNGDIVIMPVMGASGKSYVRIVDQYTIGNPEIQLPIRIVPISGLDLKLIRYDNLQSVSRPLSQKQADTWIFQGQQFVAYVDVYTFNSTLNEMGKQPKQAILGVDPEIIQLNFQKGSVQRSPIFKQVSRSSDKNGLVVIRYRIIGRIFDRKQQQTSNKKYSQKMTATLRQPSTSAGSSYAKNPIISNTAVLNIYNQISLSGTTQIMPVEQLSININDKNKDKDKDNIAIQRKFDSYIHILESCETVVEINGGPSQLKSRIISNSGQSKFYNVHKLSQRSYKIQSIQSTPSSSSSPSGNPSAPQPITGRQKNLLVLQVYIDSPKSSSRSHQIQLATIRSVIFIQPIKNIHISGLSQMLVDKESRYLVEFGEEGWDGKEQSWRDYQCSLKYKWDIVGNTGNMLQITSDPTKMSINISTSLPPKSQQSQMPASPQLSVTIYNKFSRQIGRSSKQISIISQTPISTNSIPIPITTNNQLLLIPSNSAYIFPDGITVEEIVPCQGADNGISVVGAGELITADATRYPQLVRMYTSTGKDSLLAVYVAVQVVDICAVVIQNYDGSITINPSSSNDNVQIIKFYLLDCLSRKLLPAKYSKISYKVSITHSSSNPDPSLSSSSSPSTSTSGSNIIASASIYSAQQNLIALKGHEIGSARLVLQVMHNDKLKARDVLPVYVNVFMRPAKPFTTSIGNTISFKGPTSQSSRHSQQKWSSSNPQVLKIDPQTGEAIALSQGQVQVKYGTMSTKVGVIKIVDVVKVDQDQLSEIGNGAIGGKQGKRRGNGYLYQLVYSGKKIGGDGEDAQYIRSNLAWTCQILTKQSKSFRCHIYPFTHNQHTYLSAQIQKIPHTQTVSTPISNLQLKIGCSSPSGFSFSKSISQTPQFFILLSEHYVSLRDPSLSNRQNYQIVVQTNERLRYRQVGGKQGWLLGSQFNGVKQVISVDLTQLRNDWKIEIQNQRTGQRDTINFGFARVEERETSNSRVDAVDDKDGWKWTDILVIFMAVNFLILIVYQIYQSNSSEHIKSY